MKRRPKGSGTIEKTRDGKFRARFPFRAGERTEIGIFDTHAEAEGALDAILTELHARSQGTGNTLKRIGDKLLELREKEGYRSVESEKNRWKTNVAPWECFLEPIETISPADVRQWVASMPAKKEGAALSTQTKRNALNLLRAVFAYAVDEGWLETNPAGLVRVKARPTTRETSTWLTADEARALIEASSSPEVVIAIYTGLRSGELIALEWTDVSDTHATVRYGSPGKPTKNGKTRRVPLLAPARAAFAALRKMRGTSKYVFPSPTGHHRPKGQVVERELWTAWLTTAKIKRRVRWHDLRHTCATLLLTGAWGGAPWSYEAVKDMLGHSSVKVTERYARAVGLADAAAQSMQPAEDKPADKPDEDDALLAQAVEYVERCGWDLNPRMSVLQNHTAPNDRASLDDLSGLARAYAQAVRDGDPTHFRSGLRLAAAAFEVARLSRKAELA